MTVRQHNALTAFLTRVRNRLWLQSIARLLYRALWVSALVLITCGTLHFFAAPLALRLCIAVALIPPLFALGAGVLFRRPSREAAAQAADRWFDGKALFTSAWELQAAEPLPATLSATLVLQRAQQSAARLQRRIPGDHPVALPHPAGLPFALACTGIFLLLLPGARTADAPTSAEGLATVTGVGSGPRPDSVQTADHGSARAAPGVQIAPPGTADQRDRAKHSAATEAHRTSARSSAARGNSQPASRARAEHAAGDRVNQTPDPMQAAKPPPAGTGALATAATGVGTRDTTAGGERAHHQPRDGDTALPVMAIETIEIARAAADNGNPGALGDAGVELTPDAIPPANPASPDIDTAVADRVSIPYRLEFSPAMKVYVSRYFHQLGTQP